MRTTPIQVEHLAFPSFDASRTYRFYTEVMGFKLTMAFSGDSPEWGNKAYLMTGFALGTVKIHFFDLEGMQRPRADGLPRDIRHVALAVPSRKEWAAWKKRIAAAGVSSWVEDHDGVPSLYFSDPNDVMIEITCHQRTSTRRADGAALAVVRRWATACGQGEIPAPVVRARATRTGHARRRLAKR